MNTSEKVIAATLIPTLPGEGYWLADTEFDTNPLHDLAHEAGRQIVAAKRGRSLGLGRRRHSPYRLRSIGLLNNRFSQILDRGRNQIERECGVLVRFGGGLTWVRRCRRVRN